MQAVTADTPASPMDWLEPIYREHAPAVIQAAYRVTGNAEDAEDVLQTVFTRLANRTEPPDLSAGALPYLRRAATNAALDIVQSKRARTSVAFDGAHEATSSDTAPAVDDALASRQLHDLLRRAVAGLNRRAAEVFTLRYFEGLDNRAIAETLDTSPGTVAVTLHRARTRLRAELGPLMRGSR